MRKHLMVAAALALGLLGAVAASAQTTPTLTTLHSFTPATQTYPWAGGDGAVPANGLLMFDAQGALYGTTAFGGSSGYGTVFKLTPASGGVTLRASFIVSTELMGLSRMQE